MSSFLTLLRREFIEHRGAFFYAPLILIAILTLLIVSAFVSGHTQFYGFGSGAAGYRLFDTAYFALGLLWWAYLFLVVFFYFADAFNSDWRNNSMLFWKSMPQSDFKILLSKLVAGLTILPAMVFLAFLLTGIIAAAASLLAPLVLPVLGAPDFPGTITAWLNISIVALCYLVLALLWYAPFFAWVGALSTAFGRWSVPLALVIPVVFSLFENVIDFQRAPGGGYLLAFLRQRLNFNFDSRDLQEAVLSNTPIDVGALVSKLVAGVNWPSLLGGLVFAVIVVYVASQYRRRVLKSFA
jgi:ABC-2 type transport system permease protein